MKKIVEFTNAAEAAVKDLTTKLDAAQAEAKAAKTAAKKQMDTRQALVDICTGAPQLQGSEAAQIVNSYAQTLGRPNPSARLLIESLTTAPAHFGLSDQQAGQICRAIMKHVTGGAPAGLIDWPDVEGWAAMLHDKALRQWATWIDQDATAKVEQQEAQAAEEAVIAELALIKLAKARQALGDVVFSPEKPKTVLIRNNSQGPVGLSGTGFNLAAGEVSELSFSEYSRLAGHRGFQHMKTNNVLEVVA